VALGFVEVRGPEGTRLVELTNDRSSLGRAETNDVVVLLDATVSRLHAVIERYPTGFCVRDLGSANGTFVNGEPVRSETRLRTGDELRLGDSRLGAGNLCPLLGALPGEAGYRLDGDGQVAVLDVIAKVPSRQAVIAGVLSSDHGEPIAGDEQFLDLEPIGTAAHAALRHRHDRVRPPADGLRRQRAALAVR
jgi:hypothetical protein